MSLCKKCGSLKVLGLYCPICDNFSPTKKEAGNIYKLMLHAKTPLHFSELSDRFGKLLTEKSIDELLKKGLIYSTPDKYYHIIEESVLYIVLIQTLHQLKLKSLRRILYITFSYTTLFLFYLYINYLPKYSFIGFSYFLSLFILILLIIFIEIYYDIQNSKFYKIILHRYYLTHSLFNV